MSCKSIVCCDRGDYVYTPGQLPPPAPVSDADGGSCECPIQGTPKVDCLLMQVMDSNEFRQVCLVDDDGVFTLNVNQQRVACVQMKVAGQTEYHKVCLVNDGGVFALQVDQSPNLP